MNDTPSSLKIKVLWEIKLFLDWYNISPTPRAINVEKTEDDYYL